MTSRPDRALSRLVMVPTAAALSLVASGAVEAQQTNPGNTNVSTGSGAGTSPGVGPGSSPSTSRIGTQEFPQPNLLPDTGRQGQGRDVPPSVPLPRGLPGDTALPDPLEYMATPFSGLTPEQLDRLGARVYPEARAIVDPADRALALLQVAQGWVLARDFPQAANALRQAGLAAVDVPDQVVHDQRLMAVVVASIALAEEFRSEGLADETIRPEDDPRPLPSVDDRVAPLREAETILASAGDAAAAIHGPSFRSEMLYKVARSQSTGAQDVALAASRAGTYRPDLAGMDGPLRDWAITVLDEAEATAQRIRMPVWRDAAMVAVSASASNGGLFEKGLQIAGVIPQPSYRASALIRVAEAQARGGLPNEATSAYNDAARAIASIRLDDPRGVITNVLIDSLLAVGRFDDARRAIVLYATDVGRNKALGAVAQSQGERGQVDAALAWIERDAPPDERPRLRQRVYRGVVLALERARIANLSDVMSGR